MEPNIVFKRKLVRRKKFFSVSIPPQLGELLGDCQDVKLSISSTGILIEPV
jgi:hypothetical protein